jgi:hypothetical protein
LAASVRHCGGSCSSKWAMIYLYLECDALEQIKA